jgi:hypothetical protein
VCDGDDGKIGKVRARWGDSAVGKDDNRRDWVSASATIRLRERDDDATWTDDTKVG